MSVAIPSSEFLDPPICHVIFHVMLRQERVLAAILRPYNLSVVQWRSLVHLGRQAASMNELAEYLVVDRTTLTRTVDKLVAAKLVLRAEPAHDRRITQLTLTTAGESLRRTTMQLVTEHCNALTESVPADELRVATRVMEKMLERLVGHRAGARRIVELGLGMFCAADAG